MDNVLEDPVSWVNTYLPPGCFSTFLIPGWTVKAPSGWSSLCKGAISVVVTTALVLAVNHYYQRRKRRICCQDLPSPPLGPQQSSTTYPVERRRRLKVPHSPSQNGITRQTSEMATVSFMDSDSDEEDAGVKKKSPEINIVAIVDERGTEGDDESSETESNVLPNVATQVEPEDEKLSLFIENDGGQAKPALLPLLDPSETEVSEFNLTFESDSNDLEQELISSYDNSGTNNKRVVMDLEHNGQVPSGYVEEEEGGDKSEKRKRVGRRLSYDHFRTSVCGGEGEDDQVVTQTVVTIEWRSEHLSGDELY